MNIESTIVARRIAVCILVYALTAGLAGCQMPAASIQLLDGLDATLGNVSDGNRAVRQAAEVQLLSQQEALDNAFESDLRSLATPAAGPATVPDEAEQSVRFADIIAAKRFYDMKRVELAASQAGVAETFDRLDRNLTASRQMVGMLRRMVIQQNVMAGQADMAVQTLLQARKSGK